MLVCFKEPRKLVVLFDHVGWPHFLRDEIVDMEEHTIHVLIDIPEVNGTLEPTLESRKSDGAVVITASLWPGLLVFFIIVVFL
jgi:hypothetical protein